MRELDVLIVGAGPIGLACGISCKREGLSYVIIDKGCLVNSIYNYPLNMTFFSTSERLEIGNVPFISHDPNLTGSKHLNITEECAQQQSLTCVFMRR
jgi:thioredoxin reductase (NADPH)